MRGWLIDAPVGKEAGQAVWSLSWSRQYGLRITWVAWGETLPLLGCIWEWQHGQSRDERTGGANVLSYTLV